MKPLVSFPHGQQNRPRTLWLAAAIWTCVVAVFAAWALQWRLGSYREHEFVTAGVRLKAVNDTLSLSFRQLSALPRSLAHGDSVPQFLKAGAKPPLDGVTEAEALRGFGIFLDGPVPSKMSQYLGRVSDDFGVPLVGIVN